ncbi:hypothetical protein KSP39_PZI003437 [Platanthera zijinensis]|uniref:Wall-associated receptor kinase galacturonan-binding domain-containing protein n=1 Tax=Platanthera zijinensis TaxID=2320716 RepID=A0AAP0BWY0_9ASPA
MGKQSSSPSPSVIHCFIFFISIGFTEELPDQQHCNPSSCGEIQIAYPFRLKGDPQNCGDPNYELTCSGNRAFMEFHSSQYSVKQINYDSKSIQVIEIGLLRSNCSLPLKSLSATSMLSSNYYHLDRWTWIGIMNCSKKLLPQKYQLFPCQSRKDSYLYGVWGYLLIDLAPSCSFFSMMPTSDDLSVQKDLFQAIHEGFSLSWNNQGFTTAMLIRECLRQSSSMFRDNYKASNFLTFVPAVFKAEMHFPACVEYYTEVKSNAKLIFRLSICVLVIIEIVQIIISENPAQSIALFMFDQSFDVA